MIPLLLSLLPCALATSIWIEGEATAMSDFNQHGWYSSVQADLLSPGTPGGAEGDWLAHFANDSTPVSAIWSFEVEESGSYELWMRTGCYRVAQWVSVDGADPVELDIDNSMRDVVNLVYPTLDIRFLGWIHVGAFELEAGTHAIETGLEPHPEWAGAEIYGGVDVLHFTTDTRWGPAGAMSPEDTPEAAPEAWFPYTPGDPPAPGESVFGTEGLIERPAGTHGPLRADLDTLRFEDGTAVRFWGLNASPAGTAALRERQAAFYASLGVNLVRLHPVQDLLGLPDTSHGEPVFDATALATLDHWFWVLKEQGIYMEWSVFYPHVIRDEEAYSLQHELPELGEGRSTSGLVTFVPELQDSEWRYLQALLEHTNPYTRLRYADDPALAIVETRNEDSVFWHAPLNTLAAGSEWPEHTALLQRRWAEWLQTRYDSDEALLAAWGPSGAGSRSGDSLSNPAMTLYGAWEMESDGPWSHKDEKARMGDFIRFLAEIQRDGYERRHDALRDLGFEGLISSTAWMSGGPAAHAANLWTDASVDLVDRHQYQCGSAGSWRIEPGTVDQTSHFDAPGGGILGRAFEQVEGLPFMMSEWSQCPPNPYKAEILPLVALYGMGLHGWDASLHFAGSKPWMRGGWPDLGNFVSETPHFLGQFPALALAVHRGDITESAPVASRRLREDDLFLGVDPLSEPIEGAGWEGDSDHSLPDETFAMGRVTLSFDGDDRPSEREDWEAWTHGSQFESLTGELLWESDPGFTVARAERTQAILGFAGGRSHTLPAFEVELETEFAVLLFTSLDGEPLSSSRHVLLSAVARELQTGALFSEDGSTLLDPGGPPLLLEPVRASILFLGPSLSSVRPLDPYGVPRDLELEREGNLFTIDGRYQATHYELRAEEPDDSATPDDTSPDDETADTGSPEENVLKGAEGCGCGSGGGAARGLGLLLIALAWRRRERTHGAVRAA